jgi:queuine tRNA-ribosyltransferase
MKLSQKFIPVLNTDAGLCLTGANWEEVGVHTLAVKLVLLMVKPGISVLKTIPNLNQYLGWSGDIILNCGDLTANRQGVFTVISSFDGSKLQFSYAELLDLIEHLKPKAVLLPQKILAACPEIINQWNNNILPFFAEEDLCTNSISYPHGVYYHITELGDLGNIKKKLIQTRDRPNYLFGRVSLDLISEFQDYEQVLIESDAPADNAMNGYVYSNQDLIDLNSLLESNNFTNIAENCQCITCSQRFTKAYLHHLLRNTPLLCQRFLIQHNISYLQAAKL